MAGVDVSIVAWDGKTIVADKQATCADMRFSTTKLRRIGSGEVLAIIGLESAGQMLMSWYEDGADPEKWPKCQEDKEDWVRLVVASKTGCKVYERHPVAMPIEDSFMAWGSGRDYAMGAMAEGANARRAVEVAMKFNTACGMGIDSETFE